MDKEWIYFKKEAIYYEKNTFGVRWLRKRRKTSSECYCEGITKEKESGSNREEWKVNE